MHWFRSKPVMVTGQTVVRNGRIVVADTSETIAHHERSFRQIGAQRAAYLPRMHCGYLTVREVTPPVGFDQPHPSGPF